MFIRHIKYITHLLTSYKHTQQCEIIKKKEKQIQAKNFNYQCIYENKKLKKKNKYPKQTT